MKKDHTAMVAFLLIPLYIMTVFNLFWPDKAVSTDENRSLKQRPAVSWQGFKTGEYTQEYEEYFSDQFPFRSFFVSVNSRLVELMTSPFAGDVELVRGPDDEFDIGEGERLENDPDDKVVLATPTPASSTTLAGSQTTTGTTEPTASQAETTASAATPTPEPSPSPVPSPTTTKGPTPGVEGKVETVSGVIILDNRAMELFYFSESRSERYVQLVNRLQEKLPQVQVYSLIAPTALEFYSPDSYHSGQSSQVNAIKNVYSRLSPRVKTVDAYSYIVNKWQDYLYFRTDHHWTARGAHCAYQAFAGQAGFTAHELSEFETGVVPGDFLGSLYRYTKSSKLKNNPDFVEYFLPRVESEGIAFSNTKMAEGYRIKAVRTTVDSTNKYLAFIQGDNPLVRLTTSLKNGRKIVVLKESFGNALVPFLLNHYEEVYVIDPRSLKADLPAFIQQHGIEDVLVINYAFAITNTKWLDGFAAMIG